MEGKEKEKEEEWKGRREGGGHVVGSLLSVEGESVVPASRVILTAYENCQSLYQLLLYIF